MSYNWITEEKRNIPPNQFFDPVKIATLLDSEGIDTCPKSLLIYSLLFDLLKTFVYLWGSLSASLMFDYFFVCININTKVNL